MRRGILIALLVPAVAFAGPKKKKKKAAAPPPPVEEKKEPEPAEEKAAPTPEPPGTPTVPTTTKPGTAPATSGPLTTKPGTPTVPLSGTTAPTGTPAPTPSVAPPKEEEEPPAKEGKDVDVDALRQEYLSLRDELFKSRARANAVASQLYSTRVSIKFSWGSARHYGVSKASIRLDGATVYEDTTGAIANDDGVRFNGFVAPGRHLITFHVEAAGKDDDSFTSSTESQVVVKAVANKDLMISAKGRDNGDIAYEWKRSEKGSYGLGIDVSVKTAAAAGAKK
ncbi:MAG TPA: hypothetical protein VFV99_31530 [Kofleriaceae bacterium]|nr:hypothetical protein [Kofleriaceae bacterium]